MKQLFPDSGEHVLVCQINSTVEGILAHYESVLGGQDYPAKAFGILFTLCCLVLHSVAYLSLHQKVPLVESEVNIGDTFIDSLPYNDGPEIIFALADQGSHQFPVPQQAPALNDGLKHFYHPLYDQLLQQVPVLPRVIDDSVPQQNFGAGHDLEEIPEQVHKYRCLAFIFFIRDSFIKELLWIRFAASASLLRLSNSKCWAYFLSCRMRALYFSQSFKDITLTSNALS